MADKKDEGGDQREKCIEVVCRFRPQLKSEEENGGALCVTFVPDNKTIVLKNEKKELQYSFDRIFPCETSQEEIFNYIGKPVVQDVLRGYNSTLFAYGQTSAGKTFTMMNLPNKGKQKLRDESRDDLRGLGPRIISCLFDEIDKSENCEFTIKVSYFEIYMERANDLLEASKENLQVKEMGSGKGFHVVDLTELYVACEEDIFRLIEHGNRNRQMATTNMNRDSSRSHTILSIIVTQQDTLRNVKKVSKLFIVDLAGSEKVSKTLASGIQLEEAKSINQSLATLGKVINSLADESSIHIPYRESKLTKLLQDSLGGNSRTTLLINCSPNAFNFEETISTIRFGTSAKAIKNKPKVNVIPASTMELEKKLHACSKLITKLTMNNTLLSAENQQLKRDRESNKSDLFVGQLRLKDEEISSLKEDIENHLIREKQLQQEYTSRIANLMVELRHTQIQCTELSEANEQWKEKQKLEQDMDKLASAFFDKNMAKRATQISRHLRVQLCQLRREKTLVAQEIRNWSTLIMDEFKRIFEMMIQQNPALALSISLSSTNLFPTVSCKDDTSDESDTESQESYSPQLKFAPPQKENQSLKNSLLNGDTHQTSPTQRIPFTRSPSTIHRNLIVPLKAGFKKLQAIHQEEENTTDSDDDNKDNTTVLKCGYAYKLEQGSKWKKRWLVLQNRTGYLKIYQGLRSVKPEEVSLINTVIEEQSSNDRDGLFGFNLISQQQTVSLKVTSINEKNSWVELLAKCAVTRKPKVTTS